MANAHINLKEGRYAQAKEELMSVVKMNPDYEEAEILYEKVKDVLDIAN